MSQVFIEKLESTPVFTLRINYLTNFIFHPVLALSNTFYSQLCHRITIADECVDEGLIFVPVLPSTGPGHRSAPPMFVNTNRGEMLDGFPYGKGPII